MEVSFTISDVKRLRNGSQFSNLSENIEIFTRGSWVQVGGKTVVAWVGWGASDDEVGASKASISRRAMRRLRKVSQPISLPCNIRASWTLCVRRRCSLNSWIFYQCQFISDRAILSCDTLLGITLFSLDSRTYAQCVPQPYAGDQLTLGFWFQVTHGTWTTIDTSHIRDRQRESDPAWRTSKCSRASDSWCKKRDEKRKDTFWKQLCISPFNYKDRDTC